MYSLRGPPRNGPAFDSLVRQVGHGVVRAWRVYWARTLRRCRWPKISIQSVISADGQHEPFLRADPRPARRDTGAPAVTAGAGNRDIATAGHWRYEVAQWLAAHLQTTVIELPGAHMGYLGQPEHFAKALRPILDRHT